MSEGRPVRLAVVPPVPVPYREPLFAALAARRHLALRVIYQAARAPGWDQAAGWFPQEHPYDSAVLRSRQLPRRGRPPVIWPTGLERELARFAPDCVVVSEFGPTALRALAWCTRRRRALVILTEVTAEVDAQLPPLQRAIHRRLARRAAGFVATSSAARRRLLGLGVDGDRVQVSLQSADVAAIRTAAAAAGAARATRNGPVRLLTVARLVADKNLGGLLDAFARSGLAREAELDICGSGPLEQELRADAARRSLPVRFHGFVAPDALAGHYAAADAFVLPSTWEPFGVAVREAVAAGLPILCSRVAGAAGDFAIERTNAILFAPDDPDEIAAALRTVCGDAGRRAAMAAASRRIDAEHGIERDVEAFERAVLAAVTPRAAARAARRSR